MAPHRLVAQSTTSLLPDAAVLPSRGVRFRVLTGFTRYDAFLGNGGHRNIGALIATDTLGVAQIPSLTAAELGIRQASGISDFVLNVGRVTAPANSRIVTAPLVIEYGLTSRIQLGVVIPLVETRTTLVPRLNGNGPALENVGPNPTWFDNPSAAGGNQQVVDTLTFAATSLQKRLAACTATPSDTGCAALLGQQATIQSLIASTQTLAATLKGLYGIGTADSIRGQQYIPRANSTVQAIIDQRVTDAVTQIGGFLGTTYHIGKLTGAQGPAALRQLNRLFTDVARDTLQSTDHSSIGDISVGASVNLLNSFGDTTGVSFFRPQYRLTVNGTFRIGTGQPGNRNRVLDVPTGYGQHGITGGAALDLRFGTILSGSAIGSYTAQLGTVDVSRVPGIGNAVYPLMVPYSGTFSAGNVTQLSLLPRIRLAGYFALTGQYSLLHTDADRYTLDPSPLSIPAPPGPYGFASSTAQQLGFGFAYTTLVGPNRWSGAIPFEVSYNHVETIAGSGGPVYKTFEDRVQLKVYLNTRPK